jgi:hypothetical protein
LVVEVALGDEFDEPEEGCDGRVIGASTEGEVVLVVGAVGVGVEEVCDGDGGLVLDDEGGADVVDELVVELDGLVVVEDGVRVADGVPPVAVGVGVMGGQEPLVAYTSTRPWCSCFGSPVTSSMWLLALSGEINVHPPAFG